MARVSNSAEIGGAVATVASRQHGLVTSQQLRHAGLTKDALHRWLRDGRVHRVARGVYIVAPERRLPARDRRDRSPRVVDVIAAGQGGRQIDGIRVHDVPCPGPDELVLVDGIPGTSAVRAIVDLAGTYGESALRETFERAAAEGVLDLPAIEAILDAGPRRRGAPCLRRVIEWWRPVAETANFEDVRSLFDLLWARERFVVEADSRRHHTDQAAFVRDHRRGRELMDVGFETPRVTWHEAEHEPEAVFATVRTQLAMRDPRVLRRGVRAGARAGSRGRRDG